MKVIWQLDAFCKGTGQSSQVSCLHWRSKRRMHFGRKNLIELG
ncbi:hypothetical protein CNE_BB1p01720 (plasmid) [Cupriavidus necator N-1]|uniref:Uncharacterized protein n=1 Tax=Cupriavidus necator (strain ATCC 43291 / DSM 13513 / CCUG 52238 / LMG 8453 / N-1) TaxID=1042878 RepID=F8GVV7_CUPNN|nr:hypothetical protein CNE_BB1p01720 [Cupriavidus necator N-1]